MFTKKKSANRDQLSRQLIDACNVDSNPDLYHIRQLIREGADINASDVNNWNALMLACYRGHVSVVNLLLKQPYDINQANNGATPLYLACQNGHELVVQCLLKQRGIVINQANKDGITPLLIACRQGHELVVQCLLKHPGIDINQAATNGATPLTVACKSGHELVVQRLLQQPWIDVNQAKNGATPLFLACQNGHVKSVMCLLKQADIHCNKANNVGFTPLYIACCNGHESVVQCLLKQPGIDANQPEKNGATPLHIACSNGHELVVQRLLQQPGIDINQANNIGATPLNGACSNGHELVVQRLLQEPGVKVNQALNDGATPLYMACGKGHEWVVQRLLKLPDTDLNQAMNDGATPLFIACQNGHDLVVHCLLQQPDIDTNRARKGGFTPLFIACQEGHLQVVQRLLQQTGIVLNQANNIGSTPLYIACQNGFKSIVECLLQQPGIDINQARNGGFTPLYIACCNGHESVVQLLLEQPGIGTNQPENDGFTPLFIACLEGHELVVHCLLQEPDIDINQAMANGITPLYMACHEGHELVVQCLLLQPGIDINQAMNDGATPLFIACQNGHEPVVKRLLHQPGIHIDQSSSGGVTPLDVARQNGHELIVRHLLEAKSNRSNVHSNNETDTNISIINLLQRNAARLQQRTEQNGSAHLRQKQLELHQPEVLNHRHYDEKEAATRKRVEAAEHARFLHEQQKAEKRGRDEEGALRQQIEAVEQARRVGENQELKHRQSEEEEATRQRLEAAQEVEQQSNAEALARMQDMLTGRSIILTAIDATSHTKDVKEIPLSYLEQISGGWQTMLGSGGFGSVYKGFDDVGNVEVAIKVMRSDRMSNTDRALFEDEIKNLSELRHPNIVSILAKSSLGGKFCMVLEFANGGSVQAILTSKAKRRVFSPLTRLYVAQSLVAALEYLHSKNIFHRDVKPENMCVYEGWEDNPKMVLIDFGIAARVTNNEASVTMTSNPGTEYFMAPEYAARCHFTEKSEVFSAGVVMTCLLLGDCSFSLFPNTKVDFSIDTMVGNVDNTGDEWHGSTKHDFATLINRCTSRNADGRPTVKQLLHELMEIRSRHAELEYRNLPPRSTKRVQAHVSSSRKSKLPDVISSSRTNCLRCAIGRRQGIMCLSNHFVCCESTCLEDLARAHKGKEAFPCPSEGCGNKFLLRDFYGKIGASVYSELLFAMDQNAERNLLTDSMANILATLKEEFGCLRLDLQEGFSSVKQEVRAGNAVISAQINSQLAAIRRNHADLQDLSEEVRKDSIKKLQQFAEKQQRREQNLEVELKAIQMNQMNSVGDPDSMENKLDDILMKLERLSLQNAKGVSLLASGRLQCPRLCLLWPCRGPRRLNMRRLLYKEYRLYFLCAHDHSLVETSITIKQTKAWVKKIAPVIKFAILSIRMLVNVYGFPIPSLPGFIPGSPGMEQFTEVVQHMEALLEQTESGALSGLKEWLDECQYEDDLTSHMLERESEVSQEAYGALAIEAYKPSNRGWMAEMEIVNKGDMYAWVKKENVEQWKASI